MRELAKSLKVIPLGGLGEFGSNMMVYELDDSAIVVDCGMMFPDPSVLGVDVLIPDLAYLEMIRDKVSAVFLTHAHEDHIGALPFLSALLDVPVYGLPLTLDFVKGKLSEFKSGKVDLRRMTPRELVTAGSFEVEPIHVTHSIVDAVALAIRTPVGVVFHTGDFKFDLVPIDGRPADIGRIADYGEKGVMLLVSDSTNAISSGYSGSEADVEEALEAVFAKAPGRIFFTTFASHIHRIQIVVALAQLFERRVHFVGRSLIRTVEAAERLGYLRIPREVRVEGDRFADFDDPELVIICTGSQGEPASALARIARDDHKDIQLRADDTVIFSARTIPGNERGVMHVIDHVLRRGAEVVYEQPGTHVSGHGYREELKTMIRLTKPRSFIPIHGTLLHLVSHAKLARDMGIQEEDVFVITNGEIVEIDSERGRILEERAPAGKVFVDEEFEEVPGIVMRDRQHLGEDGFVIVVAAVDVNTGKLSRDPEIITRGVVHVDASAEILEDLRTLLIEAMAGKPEELRDIENVQEMMRSVLRRYFRKRLGRRPMILPVVWEM